jgi:NDP-sugar pyrophosphorylase family protein
MKVVFLCGGTGKRMFPITEDKFLLKFLGKTLLEHQIELARKVGLTEFIIVGNTRSINRIEDIVASIEGIKVELAVQKEPTGIGNALQSAAGLLNDEVIVTSPNDVFDGSAYTGLLAAHRDNAAVSYLLGYEVNEYFPGGYLVVNEMNELLHIIEKPGKGNEPSNLVNVLLHLHTDPQKLLASITNTDTDRDDVYERAIDSMVKDGQTVKAIHYTGSWTPIKYPWHIFSVVKQFLDNSPRHIAPSAQVSDSAVIDGQVVLDENVRVFENAVIRGPVYIGANSVVGNGSLVRGYSHIGADCVVGFATEIKGSYIGDGCWFHMCYVGDSVIGDNCSFGANTVFANWRFDEKNIPVMVDGSVDSGLDKLGAIVGNNCRTGVNSSLMPGVRVGPHSIVGAHVCLTRDLEPDSIAVLSPNYKTTRNVMKPNVDSAAGRMKKLNE